MKTWQITTSIISLILTLTIIHNSSYAQTPQNPCYPLYQDPYFGNCERLSGIYPQPIVNGTLDVLVKTEPKVLTANATEDRILHIKFFDKGTDRPISYLSFILNVTKGDQRLMSDRFFNINGTTTIDFQDVDTPGKWEVLADQYFTQGWINYEGPIVVKAPIFHELGLYHISLTIDNPNDRASTSNKIMYNSYVKVDKNNFEVITSSPLKQFKSGIAANDVTCRQGLQLIFKFTNGTPACVTSQTKEKLFERGWGTEVLAHSHPPIPSQ